MVEVGLEAIFNCSISLLCLKNGWTAMPALALIVYGALFLTSTPYSRRPRLLSSSLGGCVASQQPRVRIPALLRLFLFSALFVNSIEIKPI